MPSALVVPPRTPTLDDPGTGALLAVQKVSRAPPPGSRSGAWAIKGYLGPKSVLVRAGQQRAAVVAAIGGATLALLLMLSLLCWCHRTCCFGRAHSHRRVRVRTTDDDDEDDDDEEEDDDDDGHDDDNRAARVGDDAIGTTFVRHYCVKRGDDAAPPARAGHAIKRGKAVAPRPARPKSTAKVAS